MPKYLAGFKSLMLPALVSQLVLSGCVVITTYEARPSVTEKAAIRGKCINRIYDCKGECTTDTVYEFERAGADEDGEDRQLKRQELEKCMTHYQENLRSYFSNSEEYEPSDNYKNIFEPKTLTETSKKQEGVGSKKQKDTDSKKKKGADAKKQEGASS